MSYQNEKATILLASRCICCGRALRDAPSVERGVGPDCADKYGYAHALVGGEPQRKLANTLIHEAASVQADNPKRVIAISEELRALGLTVIAAKIAGRFIGIRLVVLETTIEAYTPWHKQFGGRLRSKCPSAKVERDPPNGNNPRGKFKCWIVAKTEARALLGVLAHCYPGQTGLGRRGNFIIPTVAEYNATYAGARSCPSP